METGNVEIVTANVTAGSAVSEPKRKAGRPQVYAGAVRDAIVTLIKNHGATGASKILSARQGAEKAVGAAEFARAEQRRSLGLDKALRVSMPTLLKIARENGVVLKRGAPKNAESAAA